MSDGSKPRNHSAANDLPFVPKGWCCAPLGEIADISSGITKGQRHRPGTQLREVPYLRVANVQRGYLDLSEITTIAAREEKIQALRLQIGDVLFTEGGDRDKLGRGCVWNGEIEECIHQNHIFRARLVSRDMDPKFVSFHGNFFGQDWFLRNGKQTTNLASINQSVLRRFPVPLPPANEQRRIVAKIEELFSGLDAGVAALKRAKANLKRYRAAVLKAAVEGKLTEAWRAENPPREPASELLRRILKERRKKSEEQQLAAYEANGKRPPKNWRAKYKEPSGPDTTNLPPPPDGWCWASLSQVGHLDRGRSRHRPRNAPHLYGGPYPFVQTGDVRHANTFIRDYAQTYSEDGLAQSRLWRAGTLCITIAANIAETAILTFDACFPDSVVGFLPASGSISVRYVELYLRTIQHRLEAYAPATAQKNINLETLNEVAIVLPPAEEQNQIVAEVDQRLSLADIAESQIDKSCKRSSRLRQSILKRAFEGKLIPQDPTDEPASELLERIKAGRTKGQSRSRQRRRKRKSTPETVVTQRLLPFGD